MVALKCSMAGCNHLKRAGTTNQKMQSLESYKTNSTQAGKEI